MAKNEFELTSIFKIIISTCKKIFEFCGKTFKFLPRCLFILCAFYLNKEESMQQVSLKRYIENEIFNSTSHKRKKQKKRSKNVIQLDNYHL